MNSYAHLAQMKPCPQEEVAKNTELRCDSKRVDSARTTLALFVGLGYQLGKSVALGVEHVIVFFCTHKQCHNATATSCSIDSADVSKGCILNGGWTRCLLASFASACFRPTLPYKYKHVGM